MNIDFLDKIVTIKDIPKESPFEPCLIENNEKQIGEICTFLQSDSKLLLVNGFKGTGKTSIINFVSTFPLQALPVFSHITQRALYMIETAVC